MKILITGGHLSPALALIDEIKDKWEVVYVGRKYAIEGDKALALEYQEVPKRGIKFIEYHPGRIQRSFGPNTSSAISRTPKGFLKGINIVRSERPDVVVGFGGYVEVPIIFAAWLLKIPVVIHEQTQEAGMANKISGWFASKICVSFKSSLRFFPKNKTVFIGPLIRREFMDKSKKVEFPLGDGPLIYVTGGSLGSHFINDLILKNLPKLLKKYRIIHQTGDSSEFNDFERLESEKVNLGTIGEKYKAVKFLDPKEAAYCLKNSDIVIARGGANTTTELYYLGKPSIIIPIPFASSEEQKKNGEFLKSAGIAKLLEQNSLSADIFLWELNDMVKSLSEYKKSKKEDFPLDGVKEFVSIINNEGSKRNKKIS